MRYQKAVDRDHCELGADTADITCQIQKDFIAEMATRLLIQCTVDHFASRSMIHSTSGAGMNRHLRSGPAMTLR